MHSRSKRITQNISGHAKRISHYVHSFRLWKFALTTYEVDIFLRYSIPKKTFCYFRKDFYFCTDIFIIALIYVGNDIWEHSESYILVGIIKSAVPYVGNKSNKVSAVF